MSNRDSNDALAGNEALSGPQPEVVPLLLSSLADFWSVIEPLLLLAKPKTLCEIGLGEGRFSKFLIDYCDQQDAVYCGIDFAADEKILGLEASARTQFIRESSLTALANLLPQDVYFVDGDHNYFTVLNELRLIRKTAATHPIIILHDVAWPWGRRDQYCAPEAIPAEYRHPHSASLGVRPGKSDLGAGGFSGSASNYPYAAAEHEGGERNGVLTAVEDFIKEAGEVWQLIHVEAVFGLGILFASGDLAVPVRDYLETLAMAVRPWQKLFARLERNRTELFLIYLEQVKQLQAIHAAERGLADYTRGLEARHEALNRQYRELQEAYQTLQAVALRGSDC